VEGLGFADAYISQRHGGMSIRGGTTCPHICPQLPPDFNGPTRTVSDTKKANILDFIKILAFLGHHRFLMWWAVQGSNL
ncbi:MAG: hypothetical protein LBL59_04685, partial [Xanthomonadaceae bacterium]|nr:hypothetical protein [Xanthomonadaceae bacterium]